MHAHTTHDRLPRQPESALRARPPLGPRGVQRRQAVAVAPHDAVCRERGWGAASTRRTPLYALWTLFVLVGLGIATPAAAQVVRPFTERFATNIAGDITLIGNTLMACRRPGVTGCKGNNNSYTMVHIQDTPDATVLNRSTATLALPVGSTVAWAGLYWGGRTRADNDPPTRSQMKFRTPQTPPGTYDTIISAIPLDTHTSGFGSAYQGFAEVTALVQAGGSGVYVGADVQSATGPNGYAGWALVVVLANPALPTRNLIVFDGFANVSRGEGPGADTVEATITGFLTPLTGAFTTRVGLVVYEGDADFKGDQFRVNNINVGDAANPVGNFFNSSNAVLGVPVTTRTPSYANLLGLDIDIITASGTLPNGAREATLTFTTDEEQYYPGVLTFSNEIFQPVATFTKTVTDVNGGSVEPGDVLEYVLTAANTGNDAATAIVLEDPIPAHTTYVPGSLATLTGVDLGPKTDAAGDDQAEFTGTAVRFRLGGGADATTGGQAPPGARASFRFRVRVNAGVPRNTVISNQAQVTFLGATTGEVFTALSDSDPNTDGAQPTTVITTQARASVSLTKGASPNPVVAGQHLTYTLTVTNTGPSAAADTVVADALPTTTTFVSAAVATAPPGWTIATPAVGGTGTVTFTNPNAAVGTATFTLVVQVTPGTTATAISNTATVASSNDPASPASASVNTPVAPAQDLTILKDGPVRAAQGQALTYRLIVNNPGPQAALSVLVRDLTPPGTTFVATSAPSDWAVTTPAVGSPGEVTYTIASLPPGLVSLPLMVRVDETVPVGTTITNVVTVESPTDSDPTNNTASTIGTVVIEGTDLAVTKGVDTPTPTLGATVRYTVAVTNFGPSDATGVRLTERLPAGLAFIRASPSPGTSYNDTVGTWIIGSLDAGAGATLTLDARVLEAGTITNTAEELVGNQTDPDTTNNQASVAITVRAADLAVAASVNTPTPFAGATVTFTVTATNTGPDAATGLRVDALLPVGLSFVAAEAPPGTTYTAASGAWAIAALGVGQTATLRLTTRVESSGTFTLQAASGAGTPIDRNPANDVAAVTLTAVSSADLVLTKTVDRPLLDLASTTVVFRVEVVNRGPSTATGVVVDDLLPPAFTPASPTPQRPAPVFEPARGMYDPATGVWSIGTLQRDERAVMLIRARDYIPGTQSNTARVRSTETDLGETNNTAIVSVRVLEHDVAITKTADNPTPPLGGLVTYTIRVTNVGPDTAEVLDVYDVVTEGSSTFVSGLATQGKVVPEALPPFYLPGAPAPARLWTIPVLPVGATETLTLVERVTSLGRLTNTAATDAGLHLDRSPSTDGDRFPDNNFASTTVEVQATADVAITKRVSEATPRVGDAVTFTVTATNHGPLEATGVQVSDSLPVGLTLQSATPSQGHYDPTTGAWAVGALATGAAATLDLTARVDQAGALTNVATKTVADQFDPNPSNNAGGVTLTGLPSADIQVRQTVTNPAPDVDEDITFTLTVTNAGPTAASGVQVTDLLPAGLLLVRATPSQGTYTAATGVWDIGSLADGAHVTLDLVATVTQAGLFTPLAIKTAQGEDDPVPTNNAAGVILNGQEADLQVVTTADQTTPAVGQPVTVTETVTNSGPSVASGVQVTTPLPGGLTVVDATPSQGTYNASTGVWDLGTLTSAGAGATAVLTLTARVETAGMLQTATRAQSAQLDPNPTNDRGSLTVVGQVRADLTITKHTEAREVRPGTPLIYTLVVTNQGPSAVTGARVTDPLSPVLTDVTWACTASPGSRCPAAGTGPIDVLVDLLPGGTATFTLQTLVALTATGVLMNQATVTGPAGTVDPRPDNNLAADLRVVTAPGPVPPPPVPPPVLRPPAGVKTVETTGLPTLTWRAVWRNPANTAPLRLRVFDPIPVTTTYVDGSVTCVARGQATVEHCAFDAATNQLVAEGLVGPDPGATTEAQATNAIVLTFQTTVLPGVTQVANQALAHWDATGNGTVDDDIRAGQMPVLTGTALEDQAPTIATLPTLACLFQQRLLGLTVPASPPRASGEDGDGSTADAGVDAGVDRLLAPQAAVDFVLTTPLDATTVAGTALTLAAVPVAGTSTTVSQPAAIRLANGSPTAIVDVVEHDGSKSERVLAGEAHVSVTADGVVVALPTTALVMPDTLHLDRVQAIDATAPLPGTAVSPLVAVTLESGQTAFRAPITLNLPYRDFDHDGMVDATSPPLPALALTVWRFDAAYQRWVPLPEARVFTAFQALRVATTQTGLYGVFQALDGSQGLAGTSAPASPPPRSVSPQGSGWQDIGVVTTFPFLVPFTTTALPDGIYAVRAVCSPQLADLAAVQETPVPSTGGRRIDARGGGCSLQPGSTWSRATALAALGNLGLPFVVLLLLGLWVWRRPR